MCVDKRNDFRFRIHGGLQIIDFVGSDSQVYENRGWLAANATPPKVSDVGLLRIFLCMHNANSIRAPLS